MSVTRYQLQGTTYSDAVGLEGSGRWVYTAGQVALDENGALVDGDLATQTRVTFDHVERALARAGGTLGDVVKITVYLRDLTDYAAFAAVRGERFGDAPPASAAVAVADLLFGADIEIEAVAFVQTAA